MMKLAKRVKAALWAAVQFNREGIKKGKKGSTEGREAHHIAETIAVLFKATLVLTLNLLHVAEEGADIGYLDVRTKKYRFNSARPRLVVKLEYQHARLTELSEEDALMKRAQAARGTGTVDPKKPGQMPSVWQEAMDKKKQALRANLDRLKV